MSLQTIDFDRMKLKPHHSLLDLGCGEGRHAISACLAKNVEAVAVDLSVKDLQTTRERFTQFMASDDLANNNMESDRESQSLMISVAKGEQLPFANEAFDRVICSEVLEHIPDYRAVIQEISRVLKIGGIAAVSVPRYFPEWLCWRLSRAYHEVPGGHLRIFRASALRRDIESAGLTTYDRHHAHALHVPYWWLKCLFWREGDEPQAAIVNWYHKLLVWDLMKQPLITRWLDRLLNPIMGKSVVMYFVKTDEARRT